MTMFMVFAYRVLRVALWVCLFRSVGRRIFSFLEVSGLHLGVGCLLSNLFNESLMPT